MYRLIPALGAVLLMIGSGLWAEGKPEDPKIILGSQTIVPQEVVITKVSPLNVLPGTLVSVEGSGFGNRAGTLSVGKLEIAEFLEWSDEAIFFRIPKTGLAQPGQIQIVSASSEGTLHPAPTGSLTLLITVDMDTLVSKIAGEWRTIYKVPRLPVFTPPLFVKGEWIKGPEGYGNSAVGTWDNGSKVRMLRDKSGKKWYSEVVFTPGNISTFGVKAMKFAFEDGNDEERNLSPYESDVAFILKKDWAARDGFITINSDPAVLPSPKDKLYLEGSKVILLSYPPKKDK